MVALDRIPAWLLMALVTFAAAMIAGGGYLLFDTVARSGHVTISQRIAGGMGCLALIATGIVAIVVAASRYRGVGVDQAGRIVLFSALTSRRISTTKDQVIQVRQAGGRSSGWKVVLGLPDDTPQEILYYTSRYDDAVSRCEELTHLTERRDLDARSDSQGS